MFLKAVVALIILVWFGPLFTVFAMCVLRCTHTWQEKAGLLFLGLVYWACMVLLQWPILLLLMVFWLLIVIELTEQGLPKEGSK